MYYGLKRGSCVRSRSAAGIALTRPRRSSTLAPTSSASWRVQRGIRHQSGGTNAWRLTANGASVERAARLGERLVHWCGDREDAPVGCDAKGRADGDAKKSQFCLHPGRVPFQAASMVFGYVDQANHRQTLHAGRKSVADAGVIVTKRAYHTCLHTIDIPCKNIKQIIVCMLLIFERLCPGKRGRDLGGGLDGLGDRDREAAATPTPHCSRSGLTLAGAARRRACRPR